MDNMIRTYNIFIVKDIYEIAVLAFFCYLQKRLLLCLYLTFPEIVEQRKLVKINIKFCAIILLCI